MGAQDRQKISPQRRQCDFRVIKPKEVLHAAQLERSPAVAAPRRGLPLGSCMAALALGFTSSRVSGYCGRQ